MAYTDAEKAFHLQRMWAEGLTPTAYYRKWGHPNRSALRAWELAAERGELEVERPAVRGGCPDHPRHGRWPEATKAEALRRVRAGEPAGDVARSLGLPGGRTVRAWADAERRKMSPSGAEGAPRTGRAERMAGTAGTAGGDRLAELEARNAELEEQVAVLRELMRDPKAGDPASLSPRRKCEFGERLRAERGWPLTRVLTFFSISKSTYEYHRRALLAGAEASPGEEGVDALVRASFEASGGTYGYRRVAADTGLPQRKVRDSMRRQGLEARDSRRCRRWSSYAGEVAPAAPNLLLGDRGHDFSAGAPGTRLVTDITEMRFGPGPRDKLYWSVVLDLFDGRVVSARWSPSPDAELANSTLEAALDALGAPAAGGAPLMPAGLLLVHSDRGAHYRWPGWVAICEARGVARSMSRKGHSPDNAAMEAFFGRAKVELYKGRAWSSAGELGAALDAYVAWYNGVRLKSFPEPGRRGRTRYETIDGRRRRLGLAL